MKKWMLGLVVVAVLAFPIVTLAAGGPPTGRGRGNGGQPGVGLPVGEPLTAEQEAALVDLWEDEQHALAVYQSVIAQFGDVLPFTAIAQAEQSHAAALENAFARYGVAVPTVPTFDVPTFATLEDACAVAARAEIDNAALYDDLTSLFTQPDVLRVMANLSGASLNNHLPAFEACASGDYEPGMSGIYDGGWNRGNDTIPVMPGQGPAGMRGRGKGAMPQGNIGGGFYSDCPLGQQH